MLGRGSRLHEDKQDCLVIDFQRNFERLLDGVMKSQDDLDETVNNKKKMVKRASAKNASKSGTKDDTYGM